MEKSFELQILRPKETAKMLGVSQRTLCRYRRTQEDFPRPILLGGRAIGFTLRSLEKYLEKRQSTNNCNHKND